MELQVDTKTCTILLILGLLGFYFLKRRKGFQRKLPGPKGWPLIGNIFQMDNLHPHLALTTWAQTYGDIYTINLLGDQVVVVSGEKEIREVLVQKPREFAGRPDLFRSRYMTKHGTDAIAFLDYTPSWRARKKMMSSKLRMYGDGLQRLEEVSTNVIADMIQTWLQKLGSAFNPKVDIQHAVINIIFSLVCGKNLTKDDPLLNELILYHGTISVEVFSPAEGAELDLFPWLRFFGHRIFKKLQDFKDYHVDVTLKKLVDDYQKTLDPENPRGVLDSLLLEVAKIKETTGKAGNDIMNTSIIRALLEDTFGAGTQTTTSTLLSLLGHCITRQDFQDRLRTHIRYVIGDRQPLLKDRPQLHLVEALILEVIRMTTVLPTALPHVTTQPTSIGDVSLPKGTMVWPNLWSLHHDKRYWDNPWEFNPDRFLDSEGQLVSPDHPNRKRLLSFGAGQRVCMGESLARNRLFLFVTSLIQHFRFLPGESPPNCDPRNQKLGLVLYPQEFNMMVELVE